MNVTFGISSNMHRISRIRFSLLRIAKPGSSDFIYPKKKKKKKKKKKPLSVRF
jgi:hypothetical protein